jgi:hypothetical protein
LCISYARFVDAMVLLPPRSTIDTTGAEVVRMSAGFGAQTPELHLPSTTPQSASATQLVVHLPAMQVPGAPPGHVDSPVHAANGGPEKRLLGSSGDAQTDTTYPKPP